MFREATSMHQAAEWGMRALKSCLPHLTEWIQYEVNGERLVIIHLAVLLYNFCCMTVGLNQICNVYTDIWVHNANALMNYNKIYIKNKLDFLVLSL